LLSLDATPEHAPEEQEHADKIAERITQLDGAPDFNPETLAKGSHSQYMEEVLAKEPKRREKGKRKSTPRT
jgi:bacterioferritin (cytochrome b1)